MSDDAPVPAWKEGKERREAEAKKVPEPLEVSPQGPHFEPAPGVDLAAAAKDLEEGWDAQVQAQQQELARQREALEAALPEPAGDPSVAEAFFERDEEELPQPAPMPPAGPKVALDIKAEDIYPMDGKITVVRFAERTHTKGGIEIPESARDRARFGTVQDSRVFGSLLKRQKGIRAGDQVCFSRYAGQEIETETGPLVILRRDEVLAIIRKPRWWRRPW